MKPSIEFKIIRYKIIEMHREYTRACMYEEARLLLILLRREHLALGLDDAANTVERFLENVGLKPTYGRNYNVCRFYLPRVA